MTHANEEHINKPKNPVMITEAAQNYLNKLLEHKNEPNIGIRLFVDRPGTPAAETCLAYYQPFDEQNEWLDQLQDEPDIINEHRVIPYNHFKCYVELESEPYLEDAIIDYIEDSLGGQLTIKAPNAKLSQISDTDPLDKKINYILQTEINPGLAAHGGHVSLIELTSDQIAILRFGGGCQGCAQVDMTLKSGVEQTLIEKLPELRGVKDITDHNQKENAYYR